MRKNVEHIFRAALLLPLVSCNSEAAQPNIVLIVADDLGYADISCFGSTSVSTPNIDKLAAEGVKMTDFHTNGTVSSPTRAALMTGLYQQRTGVTGVITAEKHRDVGLSTAETTIAERLSQMGYKCGIFGKWHLGYDPTFNPINQGFDEFRGFVAGNIDYHSYIDQSGYYDMWNGAELDREVKGYITDLITDNSIDFIKRHNPKRSGKPLFLYIPYPAPHYPYQTREDEPVRREGDKMYIRKIPSKESPRLYKEIIEQMDEGVGRIVATLDNLKLTDNTIIIFCSDNGPAKIGHTGGYRGHKGSVYEGGHRVPGIVKYPGAIAANQLCDQPVIGMDLYPTFVELAGGNSEADHIDGVSLTSLFTGATTLPKRNLFWASGTQVAMRDCEGWKLVAMKNKAGRDKTGDYKSIELFDLGTDQFEQTNIADQHTERVAKMLESIEEWEQDVNKSNKK